MTRKCYNHIPHTISRHREEETGDTDNHMTARTHLKKTSNFPFLSNQSENFGSIGESSL